MRAKLVLLAAALLVPRPALCQQAGFATPLSNASNPGFAAPGLWSPIAIPDDHPTTTRLAWAIAESSRGSPSLGIQDAEQSSGWRKGMIVGGLIGAGFGLAAFLLVDSFGCDSCSGVSDSFADGAGPEFVIGFGIAGAAIGALVGR